MSVKKLLAVLVVAVLANAASATDGDWERFADGSLGQTTTFRGAGGLVIPAYVRKPKGEGRFPVVVMLHGGRYRKGASAGMGRSTKAPLADFIHAGWAVYCTDYRPNDKISLEPIETDDTVEAIKAVGKLPYIDPQRVGLWGASHGANVSSRVIARADLRGAILCAPAAMDLIEVKKADGRGEPVVPILRKLIANMEKKHGAKAEEIEKAPAKYGYSSALTETAQVRCPLLIINARNDDNSPVSIMELYVEKLRAAGKRVETYLPDKGRHGFYVGRPDGPEYKEATRRSLAFFRECFKTEIAAKERQSVKAETPKEKKAEPKVNTSKLVPLTDLGKEQYQGFAGDLYPDGKNERPPSHEAAGLALAKQVQPLDADGKPSKDGKIVLLAVGFSNTVQVFNGFMQAAGDDNERNPKVVLVNGAMGGMSAHMIQDADDNGRGARYWSRIDEQLKAARVTRAQVQVIWIKETNPAPHAGGFPKYIRDLQAELTKIVHILPKRFPNVKLVYLSSRTYGGWAKAPPGRIGGPGNSEPYSYESGFAVKWLIEQQLKGEAELNYESEKGAVQAPWLSWGPYLWANGTTKRMDGFSFQLSDFRDNDRMHHSLQGQAKMGRQLLQFFKSDTTSKGWFVK